MSVIRFSDNTVETILVGPIVLYVLLFLAHKHFCNCKVASINRDTRNSKNTFSRTQRGDKTAGMPAVEEETPAIAGTSGGEGIT